MGKYMRKTKLSGEVAVVEVQPLGVRTRARAAMLKASSPVSAGACAGHESSLDYLELRSRRLEKPPPPAPRNCKAAPTLPAAKDVVGALNSEDVEVSFGDNVLELEAMDRRSRETTPCSFIRVPDTMDTPGSTTRQTTRDRRTQRSPCSIITPSDVEIEEFFSSAEQHQKQMFMETYNFDVERDCPLPGRYEWERLQQ